MTKAAELAKMGEVLTNGQIGGRRNIIINGAMQVAQRGTSTTGVGTADGYFACDRWNYGQGGVSQAGRQTISQSTDTPDEFKNSLKLDCTTADTSIAAGEAIIIRQRIEGQDLAQLKKGTSDAETVTVSFYAKANGNFNYVVELEDVTNTRHIAHLFSVTSSWQRFTVTFAGDTSGALTLDTASRFALNFWLHGGATYTGGTLQTTWAGVTAANRAAGISSFNSSTDNTFFITGVQMEVGSVATPFEHRSFGEELALCQRYFYRWKTDGEAYSNLCIGGCTSTSTARGVAQLPQIMRSNASVSSSGTFRIVSMGGGVRTGITITINRGHTLQPFMDFSSTGGSNLTVGNAAEMGANNDNDSIIDFNAEL
tara:strand:+ start:298 stop:1404 length:1107 start_codon:yes stop_codon:yes gene_type:complete